MTVRVLHGDCLELLPTLAADSIDAVVTDPPYDLTANKKGGTGEASLNLRSPAGRSRVTTGGGFMGKAWDATGIAFTPVIWRHALRVLKPGGHLLAFGGSRTYHRLACAVEDAGFEIRDQIQWLYGSGFPKSLNVSKAIDKRGGNAHLAREIGAAIKVAREARGLSVGECDKQFCNGSTNWSWFEGRTSGQRPPTPETFAAIAEAWPELSHLAAMIAEAEREITGRSEGKSGISAGNGSAGNGSTWDKVAAHYDVTAPATDAARQWEGWGTALKPAHEPIVMARKPLIGTVAANVLKHGTGALNIDGCRVAAASGDEPLKWETPRGGIWKTDADADALAQTLGRWPANVIHDGSTEVLASFPETTSGTGAVKRATSEGWQGNAYGKESRAPGTPNVEYGGTGSAGRFFYTAKADDTDRIGSKHPTVKPVDLIAYLCRLITPPNGVVLDPFAGSGSTGMACLREGFDAILIEREAEYVADIERRIAHVSGADAPLFAGVSAIREAE